VNVLGDIAWGSHVCVFYESKEDLLDTVVPYFRAGLESNEFCLWAPSEPVTLEEARMALSRRIPAFDRHLAAGSMEMVPGHEWYLKTGRFDLERIISAWHEKLRDALAKGYDGMRVSGNAFWLNTNYWNDFCDYERALSKSLESRPMMALCTYPIVVSGAAEVLEVARVHHLAVARRNGDWELVVPVPATAMRQSLTPREREVLWWAAEGKSASQMGELLHITKRTVDEHTQKAVRKLGAANRTEAVAIALRERLIGPSLRARGSASVVTGSNAPSRFHEKQTRQFVATARAIRCRAEAEIDGTGEITRDRTFDSRHRHKCQYRKTAKNITLSSASVWNHGAGAFARERPMASDQRRKGLFDPTTVLTGHGSGQSRKRYAPLQVIYVQDDAADACFYVESGWVKISTVAPNGKEAVIAIRREGEFFGTRCLVAKRTASTTALTACSLVRTTRSALIRLLRDEPDFAVMFATYLVGQSIDDQENLVDHLTNPAEKRLARALLQLAGHVEGADPRPISTPINQGILANMIGTTRSRVNFFMNRFKRQGFIEYSRDGQLRVRGTLRRFLLKT
jgi:CRP-like cAMP-binding protein/DNA-binding CsgD family transcriptional regulator